MLRKRSGLCVNARGAWPSLDELVSLNFPFLRTIVYTFDELEAAVGRTPYGCPIVVLLNSETEGVDFSLNGWEEMVSNFADRFSRLGNIQGPIKAVEILNEWDLLGYDPATAVNIAKISKKYLQPVGMKTLLGSVTGPNWPDALASAASLLEPGDVDGACFHPYGKSALGFPPDYPFGELADGVQQAYDIIKLPIWVTEYGVKMGEVGGELGQAKYVAYANKSLGRLPTNVLAAACYFAWRDDVGAPDQRGDSAFGLVDENGVQRRAYRAFKALQKLSK